MQKTLSLDRMEPTLMPLQLSPSLEAILPTIRILLPAIPSVVFMARLSVRRLTRASRLTSVAELTITQSNPRGSSNFGCPRRIISRECDSASPKLEPQVGTSALITLGFILLRLL